MHKLPRLFLVFFLSVICLACNYSAGKDSGKISSEKFKCIPCGSDCDTLVFDSTGNCPQCHMILVKESTIHFDNLPLENICSYISKQADLVLLDVRTPEEFAGKAEPDFGSLKNAINIPVQSLETRIGELNRYKDQEILVYCSHSRRSPRAAYILSQHGFTKVYNMAGGMSVLKDTSCKSVRH